MSKSKKKRSCRVCGCTDIDCRQCIEKTGRPCYWVKDDLCSACEGPVHRDARRRFNHHMTGGDLGPTGHGDICYSDADPGL